MSHLRFSVVSNMLINNIKANAFGLDELTLVKKSGDLAERLCVSLM